nr:MAG TPA: hypothetical protein [Caudoviricetes sp.]
MGGNFCKWNIRPFFSLNQHIFHDTVAFLTKRSYGGSNVCFSLI